MNYINADQIGGLARHLIGMLGGIFVAKGYVDGGMVELIGGSVAGLAAAAWSIWIKRRAAKDRQ